MKTIISTKGNKLKYIIVLFALSIFSCSKSADVATPTQLEHADPPVLTKVWEVGGFEGPESVVLDSTNKTLYVSNVKGVTGGEKDGNGYISKVSLEGSITEQKWVDGLDAPKGLVIYNGKLYATDIDVIVEINISTKAVIKHAAEGANFLNDIVVDTEGNFYASNTFGNSAIFQLSSTGTITNWLDDDKLYMPNGLNIRDGKLITAGWGQNFVPTTYATNPLGQLISVDLKSKAISNISDPIGNLDGLSQTDIGYFITDWLAGKLLFYSHTKKTTVTLLTFPKDEGIGSGGSADTYYDKTTKSIYIPLMNNGKLLKYSVK